MVQLRSWKNGLSGCEDNEELARRHNNSCDVSLCVVTPWDSDWVAVGLELKMVATSPSRPYALGWNKLKYTDTTRIHFVTWPVCLPVFLTHVLPRGCWEYKCTPECISSVLAVGQSQLGDHFAGFRLSFCLFSTYVIRFKKKKKEERLNCCVHPIITIFKAVIKS